MSPPRSAGILAPSSRMISTRSLPFACEKYPASNTTLSRGTALPASTSSPTLSSLVKRKTPVLHREAAAAGSTAPARNPLASPEQLSRGLPGNASDWKPFRLSCRSIPGTHHVAFRACASSSRRGPGTLACSAMKYRRKMLRPRSTMKSVAN